MATMNRSTASCAMNYSIASSFTRYLIECWRQHYNQVRPHSSLSYRPPAPVAILPLPAPNSL